MPAAFQRHHFEKQKQLQQLQQHQYSLNSQLILSNSDNQISSIQRQHLSATVQPSLSERYRMQLSALYRTTCEIELENQLQKKQPLQQQFGQLQEQHQLKWQQQHFQQQPNQHLFFDQRQEPFSFLPPRRDQQFQQQSQIVSCSLPVFQSSLHSVSQPTPLELLQASLPPLPLLPPQLQSLPQMSNSLSCSPLVFGEGFMSSVGHQSPPKLIVPIPNESMQVQRSLPLNVHQPFEQLIPNTYQQRHNYGQQELVQQDHNHHRQQLEQQQHHQQLMEQEQQCQQQLQLQQQQLSQTEMLTCAAEMNEDFQVPERKLEGENRQLNKVLQQHQPKIQQRQEQRHQQQKHQPQQQNPLKQQPTQQTPLIFPEHSHTDAGLTLETEASPTKAATLLRHMPSDRVLPCLLADVMEPYPVPSPDTKPVTSPDSRGAEPLEDTESSGGKNLVSSSSGGTRSSESVVPAVGTGVVFTFSPLLPPCRVCGARASGFHYGANTCEACKGFFRRSLHRKEKFTCTGRGHCEIVNSKKTALCGACRYRKCLSIGMSKQAIKTGRYTHAKKTKDTEEVKRLQERIRPITVNGEEVTRGVGFEVSTGGGVGIRQSLPDEELDKILRRITTAHKQYYTQWLRNEKEKEFVEQKSLREQVFGTLRPIPTDEYMKIYAMTGIDVDGRKDKLEEFLPYVESGVRRFIAFAKSIPGFTDLPVDDQIGIIKASRFEAWMVLCHRMFNRELRLYTTFFGQVISQEDLLKVHDPEYIEILFAVQDRIGGLDLNYDEMCLLGAFVMMFTDRCVLANPGRVEKTQDLLLQCLGYLFRKNHVEDRLRLAKVVDLLVQLRGARYYQSQAEEKLAMQWSDKIKIPALVYEMWLS